MTEQHECEHPFSSEEEILDWYKTSSNMEKLIFYRATQKLVAEALTAEQFDKDELGRLRELVWDARARGPSDAATADAMLYRAKGNGRNQVWVREPDGRAHHLEVMVGAS